MATKKSSPKQAPVAQQSKPAPVAQPKKTVPVKSSGGNTRKFLNEAFVRSIIKNESLNKTQYNQITPVALKYLVSNFSLLEDSLRYGLKGAGDYLADGKSPKNSKVSDSVEKLTTSFFVSAMKDQSSQFEAYIQEFVSACLTPTEESFTNRIIKRVISNFLNAVPEYLASLNKKSSKTLDLTQILNCLNGENRSLPLRFVSNLFPSFVGVPLSVVEKGRIVPAEAFLQKCAFEGRKKREAYTVLRWYLSYVVDQLSVSDKFYLDAITKITKSSQSTSTRNLIINFSNVILYGVNGCAGTQEMISRIANVDLAINSGNYDHLGTFVQVEQKPEEVKEKKKRAPAQKKSEPKTESAKPAEPVVEAQPEASTAKALKPSGAGKKVKASS